ncbi:TonB-dependent receptor [Scleromatobacter humisilvae]|uniref:TonB-dependent receptor n=1 Tax=Scleromatobacter humisilvae TaxID=2897159 RepID=A0A9X1YJ44_9BURK|nr:TonB-dependent receptor [Scleromatobacter humisilvae]MCK9687459.1 TonB-dependent receptor [Scleromatobacter humisilvae]
MFGFKHRNVARALVLSAPLSVSLSAFADDVPAPAAAASAPPFARTVVAAASAGSQTVVVAAARQKLDAARNGLSPDTGSNVFKFGEADIDALPMGEATPLNQVVLQAPGVVQDSYGQLHVRGDHANVQYRIDGVVIPEAISGFGQSLETRFADNIDVLTGALPAQYGYRTAAVVDIKTKAQAEGTSGSVSATGGSNGHHEESGEIAGAKGPLSWYLTGSLLKDGMGIENPTSSRSALHDQTQQTKGFGTLSYLLGDDSRLNFMFGVSNNHFEIPDVPGQTPQFSLVGDPTVNSAALDARQRERNAFEVLSYQGHFGDATDYQLSYFHRETDVHYAPDPVGDLVFDGIAADVRRKNTADGVQLDSSHALGKTHTLRGGMFFQHERFTVDNQSSVFPADADGNQTSTTPISIADDTRIAGNLWGVYLQDEWQPVKSLTINYGARFDNVDTVVDEHQLSARLGVVWDASTSLRLHAGFARYFTPPPTEKIDTTSVAKFAGTTNALPSDADTAVKSERSNYFDAGLAWDATSNLSLGVDAYDREVRNLQDEGQFGNALIYSAFNYAKGRVRGLELTANYKLAAFTAYGNLAFSKAEGQQIVTGQFNFDPEEITYIASHWVHLDHDQKVTASAGASYRFATQTTLGADALFGSGLRSGFANSEHLPSYTQVNASLSQAWDFGGWLGKVDGRLSVLNVFDHVYELRDGTGIGVGAPQFGPRRTVYASVTKSF